MNVDFYQPCSKFFPSSRNCIHVPKPTPVGTPPVCDPSSTQPSLSGRLVEALRWAPLWLWISVGSSGSCPRTCDGTSVCTTTDESSPLDPWGKVCSHGGASSRIAVRPRIKSSAPGNISKGRICSRDFSEARRLCEGYRDH
jgi:hypothetical protein